MRATEARQANKSDRVLQLEGLVDAIYRSNAVIEFSVDGTILTANENFLSATGYTLPEIRGRHHRMFVSEEFAASAGYREFWRSLADGKFNSGEYQRFGKGGREVWIQATYNPILDEHGRPTKIVKFASEITAAKLRGADHAGQIDAISRSNAVIEFELDGTIIRANQNFLEATGYSSHEIVGQHHRMFVDPQERESDSYRSFWSSLAKGEFFAGEFRRFGRGGREVHIQATYNPIMDASGRPFKVVKYATDVTEMARARNAANEIASTLAGAATELQVVAQKMVANARSNSERTFGASEASQRIRESSMMLATATEQMSSSIGEIAMNASDAASMGTRAAEFATDANLRVEKLGSSSDEIGSVAQSITSIAKQTNLLALNATIEAARAGEAGRGFSVVASEVKELASQTATATADIDSRVTVIEQDTRSVTQAIETIVQAMGQLQSSQDAIAGAVEEQSATTRNMTLSVDETSRDLSKVADDLGELTSFAREICTDSEAVGGAADKLLNLARELASIVDGL